ncbi:MAG: exonuclease domain-containing protein [Marinifilum sp.]|jgi:DNA polymerase-3 subunit epsilon|nr:exonuclease domain-containing protein [Marinifilum sp.]
MKFLVIDFETANSDSICQVGIVKFENGECEVLLNSFINPNTHFTNSGIHGITKEDVKDAPTFL